MDEFQKKKEMVIPAVDKPSMLLHDPVSWPVPIVPWVGHLTKTGQ